MSADLLSVPAPPPADPFPPDAAHPPAGSLPVERPVAGLIKTLRGPLGVLLALAAVVMTAYAPSLGGRFLWDDTTLVAHNLLIRSPLFCLEAFRHTLFNGDSNFYRPTQTLLFIADYRLWALDPFGFHLMSVLIHAANAFLLFLVLRSVLPSLLSDEARANGTAGAVAFAVALVWSVHPVHSAAVAYVSGSADTLAMLFCLTAWRCCERALTSTRPRPRAGWAAGAFGALLLGLCAKEIAFVWLVIFGACLFGLHGKTTSRRAKWGVVAVSASALLVYAVLRHLPPVPPAPPLAPVLPARGLLMIRALGDYGSLMIFPYKLFMERQVFAAPGLANPQAAGFYHALAAAGVLTLAALAAGAWWPGHGRALRRFGASWFLFGFLPISNLFSLNASVAEHWLYLPSIGFLLFLAGVALDLPISSVPRRHLPRLAATAVLLIAAVLGTRTWYRTFDWADELTFFRQTIADGGDVPRARAGLAAAYSHQHDDAQAIAVLRDVVTRYPKVLASRINLANALGRQGQTAEACTILEKAAADLLSRDGNPLEVVAVIHSLDGLETDDSDWTARRRALLDASTRRHPESWELVQLGVQDGEKAHDPARALALVGPFASAHWWHAPAWFSTGRVEAELGRTDEALATWTQAARLDVHDAAAPSAAAILCLQIGRLDAARVFQGEAVSRAPDSPRQHALFARVLERCGDSAGADAQTALANTLVSQADPAEGR